MAEEQMPGSASDLSADDAQALVKAINDLRRAKDNLAHYQSILREAQAAYDKLARRLGLPTPLTATASTSGIIGGGIAGRGIDEFTRRWSTDGQGSFISDNPDVGRIVSWS